ncbi:MAG: hypothetical protein IKU52_04480 [Clostridia bacterium]|nr:hypothetical protein [Clostridia bacterium]
MKKTKLSAVLLAVLFLLSACNSIGDKSADLSMVYIITAVFSFVLLVAYFFTPKKKDLWFVTLLVSVFVVNIGYLVISLSYNLETALIANTLAYFGSVFLPLSMLFIILNTCQIVLCKWQKILLIVITVSVFLLAASPIAGIKLYYEEVSWVEIGGVGMLEKVYGVLHPVYLVYLLLYFTVMTASIVYAFSKKKLDSPVYGVILLVSVFLNIGIWLLEQLVKIDFELLSVSYIITEIFLLALNFILWETEQKKTLVSIKETEAANDESKDGSDALFVEKCSYLESQLSSLTPTETNIYHLYIEGRSTKEVLEILNIKENTLKYHNKNIYSKLGVSSRKELLKIASSLSDK